MRTAIYTFLFCCGLTAMAWGAQQMLALRAQATPIEHVSSFNEQLALSPGMFDQEGKSDRLDANQADLQGGVLTPDQVRRVNTVLFLKELGCRRLRELGGKEQCP